MSVVTMEMGTIPCEVQPLIHTSITMMLMHHPSPIGSPPHQLPLPLLDKCLEMGTEIMAPLSARRR